MTIMMRKIAIGLAAAAIAVGGSTLSASALHGPMGSSKESSGKGSLGKSAKSHITAHRFGRHTYGMEEREYGPRHRYYKRHGFEPLLSPSERERLHSRIISRLEREPLLTPGEREELRGRIASRLEREPLRGRMISRLEREPLLTPGERERLHSRIISRLEREPLLTPGEREELRGRIASRLERGRYEHPYGYRYGREGYKHKPRYYGRR